jgi:hypothetical protein
MKSRISITLKNRKLLRLLKLEARDHGCSVADVLVRALEAYVADRLEIKALERTTETVFDEWNDPRDSDYDRVRDD